MREAVRAGEKQPATLWDPMSAWPAGRKWLWGLLAVLAVVFQGPRFASACRVTWSDGRDFFQDWSSARNVLGGRPAYLPLSQALTAYYPRSAGEKMPTAVLPCNAHPPTSILAVLPLALFDYPEGGTLWNIVGLVSLVTSLALIFRELGVQVPAWSIFPALTIGSMCNPVYSQVLLGQWNAQLLLLLTLAWAAERRGQLGLAALWIGTAAAIKIFPLLLLGYFAVRRQWKALAVALVWVIVLTGATALVVGRGAYRDYFSRVLPGLERWQQGWNNASILSFWLKNFRGAELYGLFVEPPFKSRWLASVGPALSYALVLAIFLACTRRIPHDDSARGSISQDLQFSMATVAMLLLTPICWDHYLLLLALPLALIWMSIDSSGAARMLFLILVAALWADPLTLWRLAGVDVIAQWPDYLNVPPKTYVIRRPFFAPIFLSIHFYATVILYAWLAVLIHRERRSPVAPDPGSGV
jgi:Glycosyltransferase family 87